MAELSTEVLLSQLRHDAETAAAQRIATARAEVTRLRAASSARIAALRTEALAAREHAHGAALERVRADTRERTALEWLTARAEALDRVFLAAKVALVTRAREPAVLAAAATLARDAAAYLPRGDAVARCAAALIPAMRAALGNSTEGPTTIRIAEDDAVATGALLESADGAVSIDATLERLLARERAQLAIAVTGQLDVGVP